MWLLVFRQVHPGVERIYDKAPSSRSQTSTLQCEIWHMFMHMLDLWCSITAGELTRWMSLRDTSFLWPRLWRAMFINCQRMAVRRAWQHTEAYWYIYIYIHYIDIYLFIYEYDHIWPYTLTCRLWNSWAKNLCLARFPATEDFGSDQWQSHGQKGGRFSFSKG